MKNILLLWIRVSERKKRANWVLYKNWISLLTPGEISRTSWPAAGVGCEGGLGSTLQVPPVSSAWQTLPKVGNFAVKMLIKPWVHSVIEWDFNILSFKITVKHKISALKYIVLCCLGWTTPRRSNRTGGGSSAVPGWVWWFYPCCCCCCGCTWPQATPPPFFC